MPTLVVCDETTSGARGEKISLEFATERITVRELIRERVYQEVQDYMLKRATNGGVFKGLVQPSDAEQTAQGYRLKAGREVDWKEQFARACAAYEANRVLIIVGDHQTSGLEEEVVLGRGVEATFLKLVPLVGG
jgi:hypothetical protein